MRLRIDEGHALFNARNPETPISEMELGVHAYPFDEYKGEDPAKYLNTVKTSMQSLTCGRMSRVEVRRIAKICEVLGIDANFLFDQPSIHDKDYINLIKQIK